MKGFGAPTTCLVLDDNSEAAVTTGASTHVEETVRGKASITFENLASANSKLLAQTTAELDATTCKQT